MNLSKETMDKIRTFAKEQSRQYLNEAEMTYMEKFRQKSDHVKEKMMSRLAKFKNRSETATEAQNDLIVYMNDYMKDLMAEGLTEQEAFDRAREQLKFRSDSEHATDVKDRIAKYYEQFDPGEHEAVGLFYAGFLFSGLAVGALLGFLLSGGREMFLSGGWIDTLIGTGVGGMIGIGFGMFSNAFIALRKGKKSY